MRRTASEFIICIQQIFQHTNIQLIFMIGLIVLQWLDEATELHQKLYIYYSYVMLYGIEAYTSNHEKLQNNSNFTLFYMPTCNYMRHTSSRYTNHYHFITKICKLIICIKPTYNPTNLQLIPYACHGIFTLIRRSYKVTQKLRYLPSICHVASKLSRNIQPWKATKQLKFHSCLHAHMYLHVLYIEQI